MAWLLALLALAVVAYLIVHSRRAPTDERSRPDDDVYEPPRISVEITRGPARAVPRCAPVRPPEPPLPPEVTLIPHTISFDVAPSTTQPIEVRSSSLEEHRPTYLVDLVAQTCTCPDFARRSTIQRDNPARWCKHIVRQMRDTGSARGRDLWGEAMLSEGMGGPNRTMLVRRGGWPDILVAQENSDDWISVYARTARRGENVREATGRVHRFGWNTEQRRWSYGESPPGAGQLRKILNAVAEQLRDSKSRASGGQTGT